METTKLNDFAITFALDKDLDFKKLLVAKDLEQLLNETLSLSKYTTKFSTMFMIFQCFDPKNPYFNAKDYKRIRRKTNVIELYSLLNYDKFLLADEAEIKSMLVETYLNSINRHLQMKGFDYELFYNDMERLTNKF